MSTPNEFPGPEQSGSQPSPDGNGSQPHPNAPPTKHPDNPSGVAQPPPGYQPPTGYQPPPGYQPPTPPQQPDNSFKFEMPADAPRSLQDVMPVGGFSGIFKTDGLPPMLKISYIIWLVTAGISLFFTFLYFIASLFQLASPYLRGNGARGMVLTLVSVLIIAAIVICAMKLKEGKQWARLALSAMVVLSVMLMFVGASGGGLLGIVAAVLMWMPESTAWLNSPSGQDK